MKKSPGIVIRRREQEEPAALPDEVIARPRASRTPWPSDRTREELALRHAVQRRLPEAILLDDPAEHRPAHGDRGEHRGEHADHQDQGEAADGRRPEPEQDARRDQARHVRVEDRVPGPVEAGLGGRRQRLARPQLLLHPLEDEDVGVDRHADREDEAGDAGEGEGDRDEPEDRQHEHRVVDEREAGDDARQAVVDDHQHEHEADADEGGQDALAQEVVAQGRRDRLGRDLLDGERQRAVAQDGDQVVGLGRGEAAAAPGDLARSRR